jgi:cell division initiation protein
MTLTPEDILQYRFNVRFRGFDVRQVDDFLEQLAGALGQLRRYNRRLRLELRRTAIALKEMKSRERTLEASLASTRQAIDQMTNNANQAADLIIRQAEVRAEKMLNRAHNRLAQLHQDITEMKRQRIQIETQIRAVIETHAKLLDASLSESESLDEAFGKVAYLEQNK